MGRPRATELLHLAAGLVLTAAIFASAARAYPIGRDTIHAVGWGAGAVVLAMGAGPVWRALRAANNGEHRDG